MRTLDEQLEYLEESIELLLEYSYNNGDACLDIRGSDGFRKSIVENLMWRDAPHYHRENGPLVILAGEGKYFKEVIKEYLDRWAGDGLRPEDIFIYEGDAGNWEDQKRIIQETPELRGIRQCTSPRINKKDSWLTVENVQRHFPNGVSIIDWDGTANPVVKGIGEAERILTLAKDGVFYAGHTYGGGKTDKTTLDKVVSFIETLNNRGYPTISTLWPPRGAVGLPMLGMLYTKENTTASLYRAFPQGVIREISLESPAYKEIGEITNIKINKRQDIVNREKEIAAKQQGKKPREPYRGTPAPKSKKPTIDNLVNWLRAEFPGIQPRPKIVMDYLKNPNSLQDIIDQSSTQEEAEAKLLSKTRPVYSESIQSFFKTLRVK